MKQTTKALIAATALLGTTAMAPSAFAMSDELTQLEEAAANELDVLGIPSEGVDTLTLGELALIKQISESEETTAQKTQQIEQIMGMSAERSDMWDFTTDLNGPSSLREGVMAGLIELDVEVANPDALSTAQLAQLKGVLESEANETKKKARAEAIID
ncbi:hypothetical protein [Algicella marina]|uniref:Uncharacterized protein n=1 Tax=Algicella marina TaxID=2683284 RepID=A0A6P1SVC7_9RHOB|nr:hypothetical protein [Algicella marina]QHQ33727.1 hypothetical protein GO499_00300 [Algicella marina]